MEELALQVQIGGMPRLGDFADECRLHLGGEMALWYAPGYVGYAREVQVMSEILRVWYAVQATAGVLAAADYDQLAPLTEARSPAARAVLEVGLRELLAGQPATWGAYTLEGEYEERLTLLRLAMVGLQPAAAPAEKAAFAAALELALADGALVDWAGELPDWLLPFLWLWAYWAVLGEVCLPAPVTDQTEPAAMDTEA